MTMPEPRPSAAQDRPFAGEVCRRSHLTAAFLLLLAAVACAADVAVLVEPGMVRYGGTPAISPARVAPVLREFGIEAATLSARRAASPDWLNTRRITVLVLPYGNAFPLSAFEQIRAFHRAGGCLVGAGVPFTHPCRRETAADGKTGEWRDLGHRAYFGHGDLGIGTGGFGEAPHSPGRLVPPHGNPLEITRAMLPRASGRPQWLDASTLDRRDEVLPLVELRAEGQPARPAAALIRHQCQQFAGARDVWLGQVADRYTLADRYAATQLIVRGVAWCLWEKGRLSRQEFAAVLRRCDAVTKPEPAPDQIEAVKVRRPWEDTFFPKSRPPAQRLQVVDVRPLSRAERLALVCLQGLTSRTEPCLWLIFTPWDERWLDWHKEQGHVQTWERAEDWRELFRRFASAYRGAVVPDPKLYRGVLIACNLAAIDDCIVAPEPLAVSLGIPVRHDLRGRFDTYADGMGWLWRVYGDRFSRHLCAVVHPDLAWVLGYDIQWRGLAFWVSGEADGDRPGADPLIERRQMARIFAQMPPNIGLRGFPAHGRGVGMGEVEGVRFAGSYGKILVCTNLLPNVSVMSGARIEHLKPPAQPAMPRLKSDKVYVALTMSDGDNLNTFYHYFPRYFEHPAHGAFPIGWGMGPATLDLAPGVAQWFYEHATPGDEFFADVSGIGYVFPDTYAERYRDRRPIVNEFYHWTSRYMRRLGMRAIRLHGGDREDVERVAGRLPFVSCVLPDYGRRPGMTAERAAYRLGDGTPVFHAVTGWKGGKEGLLRDIRDQVGDRRPAFVNAFVHNWTFDMDALARAVREAGPEFVFVTPSQLAELFRQARQQKEQAHGP
jgi:hypothetical protein